MANPNDGLIYWVLDGFTPHPNPGRSSQTAHSPRPRPSTHSKSCSHERHRPSLHTYAAHPCNFPSGLSEGASSQTAPYAMLSTGLAHSPRSQNPLAQSASTSQGPLDASPWQPAPQTTSTPMQHLSSQRSNELPCELFRCSRMKGHAVLVAVSIVSRSPKIRPIAPSHNVWINVVERPLSRVAIRVSGGKKGQWRPE